MKVSVSSNALCFVLGWIEGLPLFKLTGLLPPVEISKCLTRIKNDMAEAEFVASSGDVENALQSESARLLSENARLRKQFEGATMDINCLKIHSSQIESENLMLRAGEAQLRKELADIIVAKGKLESENITLRSVEVQLRKKLKEVNAQLDKLRMEPVQVGQPEKWTARVLAILNEIILCAKQSMENRHSVRIADLARQAWALIGSQSGNKAIPPLAFLCDVYIAAISPIQLDRWDDRVEVGTRLTAVLRACGLEVSE